MPGLYVYDMKRQEQRKVLVIDEGNGARQVLKRGPAPVRAVIVGVVDDIEIVEEG